MSSWNTLLKPYFSNSSSEMAGIWFPEEKKPLETCQSLFSSLFYFFPLHEGWKSLVQLGDTVFNIVNLGSYIASAWWESRSVKCCTGYTVLCITFWSWWSWGRKNTTNQVVVWVLFGFFCRPERDGFYLTFIVEKQEGNRWYSFWGRKRES